MSDAPVFMLANLVVQDATEYRKYEKGFFPLLKRRGGELITYDDNPSTFQGSALRWVFFLDAPRKSGERRFREGRQNSVGRTFTR